MSYSDKHVAGLLQKTLDVHGFGFHYAVMKRAAELREKGETKWQLNGTEFPVTNKNDSTHIDFVLMNNQQNIFLIAECKRADPAKANWCFVKAPFLWTDHIEQDIQFDKLTMPKKFDDKKFLTFGTALSQSQHKIANLGFEINTGEKGDGLAAPNKSAINAAVTQVTRSASGFFNYFVRSYKAQKGDTDLYYRFIPVIFTTAQLLYSGADISKADLATGSLPSDSVKVEKIDWLWFNYNRSENLSPDYKLGNSTRYRSKEYYEFSRTLAIVGANGIESFLRYDLASWFSQTDF